VTVFPDTSALVPVFLADHPHHAASLNLFIRCEPQSASCASHSLAEVYSTLTRLPAPHRASPEQAIKCLQNINARFRLISLEGATCLSVIQDAAAGRIIGGTIYDALIAACAVKANADRIYPWNLRHFKQLGPDVTRRLVVPSL
jgi:predicted nucleic acid-binding protein